MTATNIFYNFVGFRYSPLLIVQEITTSNNHNHDYLDGQIMLHKQIPFCVLYCSSDDVHVRISCQVQSYLASCRKHIKEYQVIKNIHIYNTYLCSLKRFHACCTASKHFCHTGSNSTGPLQNWGYWLNMTLNNSSSCFKGSPRRCLFPLEVHFSFGQNTKQEPAISQN